MALLVLVAALRDGARLDVRLLGLETAELGRVSGREVVIAAVASPQLFFADGGRGRFRGRVARRATQRLLQLVGR